MGVMCIPFSICVILQYNTYMHPFLYMSSYNTYISDIIYLYFTYTSFICVVCVCVCVCVCIHIYIIDDDGIIYKQRKRNTPVSKDSCNCHLKAWKECFLRIFRLFGVLFLIETQNTNISISHTQRPTRLVQTRSENLPAHFLETTAVHHGEQQRSFSQFLPSEICLQIKMF